MRAADLLSELDPQATLVSIPRRNITSGLFLPGQTAARIGAAEHNQTVG
jgi:hypothetical protein